MLSHTFSYGSEKEGALTGAIFSHIKWTFRFSDKLRITTLLQASTFLFQQQIPNGRISLPLCHLHGQHRKPIKKLSWDSLPWYTVQRRHEHGVKPESRLYGDTFPSSASTPCPDLGWCPNSSDTRQCLIQTQPQA